MHAEPDHRRFCVDEKWLVAKVGGEIELQMSLQNAAGIYEVEHLVAINAGRRTG